MGKPEKSKKSRPGASPPPAAYSAAAQEVRALLRRIPDGFQAALAALANRPSEERERLLAELVRGMGRDLLPLLRGAALGADEGLGRSALRVLPLFGTRAAGDLVAEAARRTTDAETLRVAWDAARAFQARGVNIVVEAPSSAPEPPRLTLRETWVSAPDSFGSRSAAARLQDGYGVWHAVMVLWNDELGVKDGFARACSRQEWEERLQRRRGGLGLVPCPADYARWQAERGRMLSEARGLPLKDHMEAWDRHMGPPPPGFVPPDPLAPVRALPAEERKSLLAGGPQLFRAHDLETWFLEAEDCGEAAQEWSAVQHRIRLRGKSDALTAELMEMLRRATGSLITGELASRYCERLVDAARVLEWRRETEMAHRAAAAALAIDEGLSPAEHPFFATLVERSLHVAEILRQRGELRRGAGLRARSER